MLYTPPSKTKLSKSLKQIHTVQMHLRTFFIHVLAKPLNYRVEGHWGFKDFVLIKAKHIHSKRHFNPLKTIQHEDGKSQHNTLNFDVFPKRSGALI